MELQAFRNWNWPFTNGGGVVKSWRHNQKYNVFHTFPALPQKYTPVSFTAKTKNETIDSSGVLSTIFNAI